MLWLPFRQSGRDRNCGMINVRSARPIQNLDRFAAFRLQNGAAHQENFVRVLSATVRDFSAVTMQLNPGKELKNKQA
jgi:hypothetical protein